jgi:hypothetical protein
MYTYVYRHIYVYIFIHIDIYMNIDLYMHIYMIILLIMVIIIPLGNAHKTELGNAFGPRFVTSATKRPPAPRKTNKIKHTRDIHDKAHARA